MQEEESKQEKGLLPCNLEAVDWWLKKWGRQAVIEGKEPLKREDVEHLIEVNGGNADGLNLSGRDLRRARLYKVDLHGSELMHTNLRGAYLGRANLQDANLYGADFRGADLQWANLEGAILANMQLSSDTNLEGVKWDKDYISVLERQGTTKQPLPCTGG